MPPEPQQSRLGELIGLNRDTELRQMEGLPFEGSDQQRQRVVPLAITPASAAVPTLHADPLFIAQIVKAVIEAMLVPRPRQFQ
ncbi:hypothetical protein NC653_029029 [Populus alba x Populus x berolinensis]|uniref:Uncharacterized protein n=1 Tax=Populus alba x Populus x berolinensis TaxID=444605 RepID=A0AAD6M147_9ROSI|nr:hypothetical protein NC653_029029 [Populus alba x Populus x berolinensis]